MSSKDPVATFFDQLDPRSHFGAVCDLLPGVSFFAKNRDFQLVAMNGNFWERLGVDSAEEVLGKTDFELFPDALAEQFRRDDERVFSEGKSIPKIVELFFNRQGIPDWYLTSKLPAFGSGGDVIGVMGISRALGGSGNLPTPHPALDRALEIIRARFREQILIDGLAKSAGLSTRQLGRLFRDHLGVSPQTFIIKTRVQAACERLRGSNQSIGDIAIELGFCDQSALTMHFRKHMGVSPLGYRKGTLIR